MSKDIQINTEASVRENTNTLTNLARKLSLEGGEKKRQEIKKQIEATLEPFSEEEKKAILWESLRQRALSFLNNAQAVLAEQPVRGLFLNPQGITSSPPDAFTEIIRRIIDFDPIFSGIAPILKGPVATFPYDRIQMEENPRMAMVLASIGHDITHIPAFLPCVYTLPEKIQQRELTENEKNSFYELLPYLYQGAVWDFEAFRQQLEGIFPFAEVNLENILKVVAAEGVVRARVYGGAISLNELAINTPERKGGKNFKIKAKIGEKLTLTGNEAALHLLLYQIIKNSVDLLQETESVKEGKIIVYAGKVSIVVNGQKQEIVAVMIEDNGPGIDITSVLRAKQKLLQQAQEAGTELTPEQQQVADDWTCLNLRIIDVINFIFEERVSGSKERGGLHGGIGLAMAKEIINKHNGCVWVTNPAGKQGAKFLLLFPPSVNGSLRQNLPQLFQIETIPVKILENIENQLSK